MRWCVCEWHHAILACPYDQRGSGEARQRFGRGAQDRSRATPAAGVARDVAAYAALGSCGREPAAQHVVGYAAASHPAEAPSCFDARLRRHRRQADRCRGTGAVRLDLPPLPRRQGADRRLDDPRLGSRLRVAHRRRHRPCPGSRQRPTRLLRRGRRAPARQRLCRRMPDRDRRPGGRQHERTAAPGHRRGIRELAGGAQRTLAGRRIGDERARELSLQILSLLEGAFVFCRASRSTEALDATSAAATAAVREALQPRTSTRRRRT